MSFKAVFINRLRILFSDKLFILVVILIPLVIALVTGYAQRNEKLGYVPVAVVDEDQTGSSELVIKRLSAIEGLQVTRHDKESAESLIDQERVEAMVLIQKGFEEGLKNQSLEGLFELTKSPSSISAELVKELVAGEVIRLTGGEYAYRFLLETLKDNDKVAFSREDVLERVESYWLPKPIMSVIFEEVKVSAGAGTEKVTIPPYAAASMGILILFVMLAVLFGSGWVCEEKANGTLQRVLSSPIGLLPVFAGNACALFVLGFVQTLIFTVIQSLLFGVFLLTGVLSCLVAMAYIICAVSLSMLMASLFQTASQLQTVTPVFSIITGLIGGCLWNLAGIPAGLKTVSLLTPQGWALSTLTTLYAEPGRIGAAGAAIGVLLAASFVMLTIAYSAMKFGKVTQSA